MHFIYLCINSSVYVLSKPSQTTGISKLNPNLINIVHPPRR